MEPNHETPPTEPGPGADRMIGRKAVERGWVSEQALAAAVEQQAREGAEGRPDRLLGAILVERGDLTAAQLDDLLDEQTRALLAEEDALFGRILLENRLVSPEAVETALATQRATVTGFRRLGEILKAEGHIDSQGLRATLRAQERMRRKIERRKNQFGRYEIVGELGRGGMGTVYRARDPRLGREVALKVMTGDVEEDRERFRREASAMARLRHPNIIPIYDVGEEDGKPYYAMDLVEGESLAEVLRRMRGLPAAAAARIARETARALAEVHGNGLVHRDVKPGNILVAGGPGGKEEDRSGSSRGGSSIVLESGETREYRVLLADFGLVRDIEGAKLTQTGALMGTPVYMSPEQARGDTRAVGPWTDVYALGAVLYEMLGGRPPFAEPQIHKLLSRIREDDPPSLRALLPGVPKDLETIVQKAMDKAPPRRYPTAKELAEDLDRYLRGDIILARPVSRIYRFRKRVARHKAVSAVVAIAAVALAAIGWTMYGPGWVEVRAREGARIYVNARERVIVPRGEARPLDSACGLARGRGARGDDNLGESKIQNPKSKITIWPPGRHRIEARLEGHLTAAAEVEVVPGKTVPLDLELLSDSGALSVEVSPPEAVLRLTMAGRPAGDLLGTQEATRLKVGTYLATIASPDHLPVSTAFDIRSDSDVELLPVRLEHEYGYVTVRTGGVNATMLVFPDSGDPAAGGETSHWFGPCRLGDIPEEAPLARVPAPVDRFRLDTGAYRFFLVKENHFPGACRGVVESRESDRGEERGGNGRGARGPSASLRAGKNGGGGDLDLLLRGRPGPITAWDFETGGSVWSSAALGDLDGDGTLDCVVGSWDKKVYALSGRNGRRLWEYEAGRAVLSSPALGDLDGEGVLDCVVGASWDKKVYALSGQDGRRLWEYETGGGVFSSPALGDLDGDGVLDCVVGSADGKVYALSGRDGRRFWEFETGEGVASSPALGDLDGDGALDCVVGSWDGKVYALSGRDGRPLWEFETGGRVRSSPALGDLDGDRCLDCVVGSADNKVHAISGHLGGGAGVPPSDPDRALREADYHAAHGAWRAVLSLASPDDPRAAVARGRALIALGGRRGAGGGRGGHGRAGCGLRHSPGGLPRLAGQAARGHRGTRRVERRGTCPCRDTPVATGLPRYRTLVLPSVPSSC